MSKIVQIKDAIKAKVEASHGAAVSALDSATAGYTTDRGNKVEVAEASIDAKAAAEATAQQGRVGAEAANRTAKDAKLKELETLEVSNSTMDSVAEVLSASKAYEAEYGVSLSTLADYQADELDAYKTARGNYEEDFLSAFEGEADGEPLREGEADGEFPGKEENEIEDGE